MIERRELLKRSLLARAAAAASVFDFALAHATDSSSGPVVETKHGKIRGLSAEGAHIFKGIHYGAPTAGAMRLLPPVPPRPWTGVYDAFEYGPLAPRNLSSANGGSDIRKAMGDIFGPGEVSEAGPESKQRLGCLCSHRQSKHERPTPLARVRWESPRHHDF